MPLCVKLLVSVTPVIHADLISKAQTLGPWNMTWYRHPARIQALDPSFTVSC